jgi:hypothetical protein
VTTDEPGYGIFPGVFGAAELAPVEAALRDAAAARTRAGARHVLALPAVRSLAEDPRLRRLADAFVGTARPFRATLFEKSASANWLVVWHQDTALPLEAHADARSWGPWSIKAGVHYAHAPAEALASVVALRVSLDPSTEMNGPLRVVPGSHRAGRLDGEAAIHEAVRAAMPVTCTVGAGGVVAMRPLVLHASSKSTSAEPRRVLHIEYASRWDFGGGIRLAVA